MDYMLTLPLPGQENAPPSEAEVELEGASFMALLSKVKTDRET